MMRSAFRSPAACAKSPTRLGALYLPPAAMSAPAPSPLRGNGAPRRAPPAQAARYAARGALRPPHAARRRGARHADCRARVWSMKSATGSRARLACPAAASCRATLSFCARPRSRPPGARRFVRAQCRARPPLRRASAGQRRAPLRFFAGHPLHAADGSKVGVLAVMDRRPRRFLPHQRQALADLALLAEQEVRGLQLRDTALPPRAGRAPRGGAARAFRRLHG